MQRQRLPEEGFHTKTCPPPPPTSPPTARHRGLDVATALFTTKHPLLTAAYPSTRRHSLYTLAEIVSSCSLSSLTQLLNAFNSTLCQIPSSRADDAVLTFEQRAVEAVATLQSRKAYQRVGALKSRRRSCFIPLGHQPAAAVQQPLSQRRGFRSKALRTIEQLFIICFGLAYLTASTRPMREEEAPHLYLMHSCTTKSNGCCCGR